MVTPDLLEMTFLTARFSCAGRHNHRLYKVVKPKKGVSYEKHSHVVSVVCIALVTPGYGAQTISGLKNIPLEWKPTETISSYGTIDVTAYRNTHFVIIQFTDMRKQK